MEVPEKKTAKKPTEAKPKVVEKDALPVVPLHRSFLVKVFLLVFFVFLLLPAGAALYGFFGVGAYITIVFLVSCGVAYVIARPILLLADVARRIMEGEAVPPVTLKRSDEVGQLVKFFKGTVKRVSENRERETAVSEIKSQFVTVAAHQLRTPLSALKWSLRLMLDGDMGEINDKQREFLQQSYQTNEHIIHLINDFLDISRIEEGRFGFQFQKIRILDSIQKAVDASLAAATIRNVRVSFVKEAPEDIEIIADENRIYTALMNMLDNAIRYSNAGSEVVVQATFARNQLEVRVADTGIGIPPAEQAKIFSRFYRASNAIRQQTKGSGLGLFIAKNIIERHGGTIGFTSEPEKGTTVFFTLPAGEDFVKKQEQSYQPAGGAM